MKYKAPEGVTGISVGGEQFNVDEQGFVTVPNDGDYGPLLAPHGFVQAAAEPVKAETKAEKKAREAAEAEAAAAAAAAAEPVKAGE